MRPVVDVALETMYIYFTFLDKRLPANCGVTGQ